MQYFGNTDIAMKYRNRFPILLPAIYCSNPVAAAATLPLPPPLRCRLCRRTEAKLLLPLRCHCTACRAAATLLPCLRCCHAAAAVPPPPPMLLWF
jgi:hypothetical protein